MQQNWKFPIQAAWFALFCNMSDMKNFEQAWYWSKFTSIEDILSCKQVAWLNCTSITHVFVSLVKLHNLNLSCWPESC